MFPTTPEAWADEAWKAPARAHALLELAEGRPDVPVAATPCDEIARWGRVRLLAYRPTRPATADPVLMVPSIINRYYVLDLSPGTSLVEHLVAEGVPVYMIDWGTPTPADRFATMDQHVLGWLHAAVRRTCRHAGVPAVKLLGYCIGGTMATMYAALRPERVAGLVALTAPIDFHDDGTLSRWSLAPEFPLDKLVNGMGLISSEWLQGSFQLLKPLSQVQKWRTFSDRLYDPGYLRRFRPMEEWVTDNVDVSGETYRYLIEELYVANKLVSGDCTLRGERVDLASITAPLFIAAAGSDHIIGGTSSGALAPRVGSTDVTDRTFPGGHIGVVVGRAAKKGFWPALTTWLQDRSGATSKEIQ